MPAAAAKLDEVDLKILRVLQQDASLSLDNIAARVGLSHSPCWRRIKRMEESKVIRARVALVDQDAMSLGITVMVMVKLANPSAASLEQFEQQMARHPEVVECYEIVGSSDYMLKIVVADVAEFEQVLKQRVLSVANIEAVRSMIALKRVKATTALPF
jgi:Lrp/AsnC family transcriptional regulator